MRTYKNHNSYSGNRYNHFHNSNTKKEISRTPETVANGASQNFYDVDNYEAYGAYSNNDPDGDFTAGKYDPQRWPDELSI